MSFRYSIYPIASIPTSVNCGMLLQSPRCSFKTIVLGKAYSSNVKQSRLAVLFEIKLTILILPYKCSVPRHTGQQGEEGCREGNILDLATVVGIDAQGF